MFANSNRLLALVLWAAVVLALAFLKWWPRSLYISDIHQGELAFTLRLPDSDPILSRMIDRGVKVSLAVPEPVTPPAPAAPSEKQASAPQVKPAGPEKKEKTPRAAASVVPPQTAAPVVPKMQFTTVVEHGRVIDKVCKIEINLSAPSTRVAACYAVIAVPAARMAALTNIKDISIIWVEGK
jgi:hypothetical protein